MGEYKIELNALDYARMAQLNAGQLNNEVGDMIPKYIHMGYGYYGAKLSERDGKYYAIAHIGSTCD